MSKVTAQEFLETVGPALNSGDPERLHDAIQSRWKPADLCGLLNHREAEVRRTVVVALGVVGGCCVVGCLTRCLHDDDEKVHQYAEDALWSIWFRSGGADACARFRDGVMALAEERYADAIAAFHESLARDPEFAEAYNQLAIAHYLNSQWDESIEACRKTLALMPTHFGAMAGLGHCHAHRDELPQAIDCYRRALAINPRMATVATAKQRLEAQLKPSESPSCESLSADNTVLLDFDTDPARRG